MEPGGVEAWTPVQIRRQIEQEYDAETAKAVAATIATGHNPKPTLERAEHPRA
jgi:hypothetical protein